jgi:hypothetical protein
MWREPRSGACFNCGLPGHLAADCPAKQPDPPAKPRALSDAEIAGRIVRIYIPSSPAEMQVLMATWKDNYKPGAEYPEAPRYPPGFLALLKTKSQARAAHSQL